MIIISQILENLDAWSNSSIGSSRCATTCLRRGATESESRIVSDHFNYLKRLTESGVVILAGRTQNTDYSSFGIVLLKAETIEAAREIMLDDPAVKNKVFRAELYPYKTSLFNPDNAK